MTNCVKDVLYFLLHARTDNSNGVWGISSIHKILFNRRANVGVSVCFRLVLSEPGVPGEPNVTEMRQAETKVPSPPPKKADDGK